MRDALAIVGQRRLYHLVTEEFPCQYDERNWKGLDITIHLRLRVDYSGKGFARWLTSEANVWDESGSQIYASVLEALVQNDSKYGLATYIHDCLENSNIDLLKANGAVSWPISGSVELGMPWLEVVSVEEVKCLPHTATVKIVSIRPGTVLCGQYKLIKRLGQGGMGQVWKAEHIRLHKNFAIKILSETADEILTATIKSEADVLSDLINPNIVNMRGYNEDGNVSFMVMDFVEGMSLENILQSRGGDVARGKLTDKEVSEWLMPIASAIDYMHTNGRQPIVHRDIKPANIMIGRLASDSEEVRRPFLCDFGIANRRGGVTNNAWGTEYYRAPEVRPGAEVTPKADVYSFAVTAYVCLTGEFPPRWTPKSFNTPLLRAISRGLADDPSKRPDKCVSLFEQTAAPQPPRKPDDVAERPSKTGQRPPVPDPRPELDGDVYLEYTILRDYRLMLGCCGMEAEIKTMNSVAKYMRKRNAWHVPRVDSFLKFLRAMPDFTDVVREKNEARAPRHNLECWFGNHGWPNRLEEAERQYGREKFIVLNAIYVNITRSTQED